MEGEGEKNKEDDMMEGKEKENSGMKRKLGAGEAEDTTPEAMLSTDGDCRKRLKSDEK